MGAPPPHDRRPTTDGISPHHDTQDLDAYVRAAIADGALGCLVNGRPDDRAATATAARIAQAFNVDRRLVHEELRARVRVLAASRNGAGASEHPEAEPGPPREPTAEGSGGSGHGPALGAEELERLAAGLAEVADNDFELHKRLAALEQRYGKIPRAVREEARRRAAEVRRVAERDPAVVGGDRAGPRRSVCAAPGGSCGPRRTGGRRRAGAPGRRGFGAVA